MITPEAPRGEIAGFAERVSAYMPTLVAGLFVLAAGIAVGWVVKRAAVRVLIWLRLDRLGGRFGWRAALGRGDTRAALYNLAGSVLMAAIILLFLENALEIWGLAVLSRIADRVVVALPNLGLALLVVLIGNLVSRLAGERLESLLEEEEIPRSRLAGGSLRGVLLVFTGALALWQLGFARQLVLGAFLILCGAIGIAFALAVGLGSSRAVASVWDGLLGRKEK